MSAKPQTLYTEATATSLEQKLDDLAAMPKGLALRTLIERLKPKIRAAQDAGHTYEDIVKTLGESGVQITVNTLKQYLREPRTEGTEADQDKAQTPPVTNSPATKRTPETTATLKAKKKETGATTASRTELKTDSTPAPTPSTPAHTQVDQLEHNPQTALATNTATQPTPLTNTNGQGFQEMRDDTEL